MLRISEIIICWQLWTSCGSCCHTYKTLQCCQFNGNTTFLQKPVCLHLLGILHFRHQAESQIAYGHVIAVPTCATSIGSDLKDTFLGLIYKLHICPGLAQSGHNERINDAGSSPCYHLDLLNLTSVTPAWNLTVTTPRQQKAGTPHLQHSTKLGYLPARSTCILHDLHLRGDPPRSDPCHTHPPPPPTQIHRNFKCGQNLE